MGFVFKPVVIDFSPNPAPAAVPSSQPSVSLKTKLNAKSVGYRSWQKNKKNTAGLATEIDPAKALPDLEIEQRPVASLTCSKRAIRKLNQLHIDEVARSIYEHGFVVPILVAGDKIVDGVTRHAAAKALGLPSAPCIDVSHLDKDQRRLLAITLNRTAENGEWDLPALKLELLDLQNLGCDLSSTGFALPELDIAMMDDPEDGASEEPPKAPDIPASIEGDVWLMGDHKLGCMSALEPSSYATLLGGASVHCVFTDPPYGVAIAGNVSGLGQVTHSEFVMGCAEMSTDELQTFFNTSLTLAAEALAEGRVMYVFMDWRHLHQVYAAGAAAKLDLINMIVWSKQGGMGSFYRSAHEEIAVFCKGKTPKVNNVKLGKHGRSRKNVWEYPAANQPGSSAAKMLSDHPTPKPVELVRDALLDCTNIGEIVLDPFLGSGTTIIAADLCGRIAYGFELDPKYADVIVRRWEAHSGQHAIHQATGKTFAAIAKERGASWA